MKCTIPEISWHNREPVLSVDIYPENKAFYRLASGGGDCHVLIWQMNITQNGAVNQEVISDLTRHQRAVNCVRWSNTGQYLASADDDANIILWQLKTDNIPLLEGDSGDKEIWIVYKVLRGHKEDIYDLCWSVDGLKLLSGSVDNTAILWDVTKGKMDHILSDHKGFVQGVSWDPKNQILATICTDRMCRIFDCLGKQVKARIHKGKLLVSDNHYLKDKEVKYFHDDTFKSFFRRLQFTPDGSLLIVPSGFIEADNYNINATLMFTLDNWNSPAVILPLPRQSSTVVRCCPILFELHEHGPNPAIKLPYRMIFAVGTDHDIILYDTQQVVPFARFQDIHYTRLTDLTWAQDGLLLVAASTDGFCALITFEMDELGIPYYARMETEEENPLEISGCEELAVDKDENVDISNKEEESNILKVREDAKEDIKKRPSFLEQWTLKTPKKRKTDEVEVKDQDEVIKILDDLPVKEESIKTTKDFKEKINVLAPRRIAPVEVKAISEDKSGLVEKNQITGAQYKNYDTDHNESMDTNVTNKDILAVRKKPKIEDSQMHDQENSSENGVMNKEEIEELQKASQNIREFFCRVPKKKMVQVESSSGAKPIEVRRKPKQESIGKDSDAKPIAVRRKPKQESMGKDSDAKPIAVRRESNDKEICKRDKVYTDAKPIAVRRKPKDLIVSKKGLDNVFVAKNDSKVKPIGELKNSKNCTKEENKELVEFLKKDKKEVEDNDEEKCNSCLKNTQNSKKTEEIVCLVDSKEKQINITPKKSKADQRKSNTEEKTPKIKVSSLVKKKDTGQNTSKRTNPLLNFIQKSVENEKKSKKKKEVLEDYQVDLTLDENDARDAWKCDKEVIEKNNVKTKEEMDTTVVIDDDKTEDFCLQLEESQEPDDLKKILENTEDKTNVDEIRKNEESSTLTNKVKQKLPRRIPLITLASPKGKTKRKE